MANIYIDHKPVRGSTVLPGNVWKSLFMLGKLQEIDVLSLSPPVSLFLFLSVYVCVCVCGYEN